MSKLLMTLALAAFACTAAAQTSSSAQQQHLVGEITAVDEASGRVNVKTDAGATVVITTDERTVYRRLPPGETSLQKAERITRADLRAGDRVLVPGGAATQVGTQAVAQLIVTTRAAAASSSPREDARRRGVAGRVVAVDAARRQIVLETRGRDAARAVTVDASGAAVRFMRYAPDSFRRADARPGAFTDIAVGDALRAFGERNDDGSRVAAEELISGTVERIVGTVSSVDAARGEVSVKNEQTGQTVVINVGTNTTLRRVPRETAEELATRAEQRDERRDARSDTPQQRQRPAGRTIQQIFESLPVIKVADLKKGDTAVVTATFGADAARATAVSLIAGEANMLRWLQRFQRVADEQREMSPGLPGNVLGGNTGSNDEP